MRYIHSINALIFCTVYSLLQEVLSVSEAASSKEAQIWPLGSQVVDKENQQFVYLLPYILEQYSSFCKFLGKLLL